MNLSPGSRFLVILALAVVAGTGLNLLAPRVIPSYIWGLVEDLRKALDHGYFHIGDLRITPVFLIKALAFFLLLGLASRTTRRLTRERILAHTSMDLGQQYALARIMGYAVFLFGLTIGLQWAGVNLNSLVIVGGAVGIGVGFGLQNIANNFVSGLILLTERPIRVGDSSLDFDLRVWTITPVQAPQWLASELYFEIFRAFREHGIEIPFPQRDLHLRSVSAPIPVTAVG